MCSIAIIISPVVILSSDTHIARFTTHLGTRINQKQQNTNLILKRVKSRIRFVHQKRTYGVTSVIGHTFSENKDKDKTGYYFESNSFFTLF
jgi:hypothetical protein